MDLLKTDDWGCPILKYQVLTMFDIYDLKSYGAGRTPSKAEHTL